MSPSPSENLRILITGFGPFPGAPYNPTPDLVDTLLRIRRPALSDVTLASHIFPVTYEAVDRELPELLARHRPDALLMFGVATRTPYVRIETRARNTISALWPDASHRNVGRTLIAHGADAMRFGPHTALLLSAARTAGVPAKLSRDAGRYLCNYLSWRALEASAGCGNLPISAFIHIPLVPRPSAGAHRKANGMTSAELAQAGHNILMAMVPLARRARLAEVNGQS